METLIEDDADFRRTVKNPRTCASFGNGKGAKCPVASLTEMPQHGSSNMHEEPIRLEGQNRDRAYRQCGSDANHATHRQAGDGTGH